MEIIEVIEPGLLTTIQDAGRTGYQRYGVPVSGAMDLYSHRIANILLGNESASATLEMTLLGPKLKFLRDIRIAITGADVGPKLNGQPIPMGYVVEPHRGTVLTFEPSATGMRSYLSVDGGFDVPRIMGSRSTYIRGLLGGYQGRMLQAGDRLESLQSYGVSSIGTTVVDHVVHSTEHAIRVIMGPQEDLFDPSGVSTFLSSRYTVTQQSDRVGCRLEGDFIKHLNGADIVSDGTPFGAVQVTGDGQPVILAVDRGVTGGYAKIATVISSDMRCVGQARPGDMLNFRAVSLEEAHEALIEQEMALTDLKGIVESASPTDSLMPRVTINEEAFRVTTHEGAPLTQLEGIEGQSVTVKRSIRATIGGESYTFDVEMQNPG